MSNTQTEAEQKIKAMWPCEQCGYVGGHHQLCRKYWQLYAESVNPRWLDAAQRVERKEPHE